MSSSTSDLILVLQALKMAIIEYANCIEDTEIKIFESVSLIVENVMRSMPKRFKDETMYKTIIAQIRVTGNIICMCTRSDTRAVFTGDILGKPIKFQTNASRYWKQQKPRYGKGKLEAFLDPTMADGSKTKAEQF
ncbi:hypothetical protein Lser_V15G22419 [Lactuca serriola]